MSEDEKTPGKVVVDEILDGPGDFYYPFSSLRRVRIPDELPITRNLSDGLATALENPTITADAKGRLGLGLCLLAINEMERELVKLRRERSGGQS